MDLTKARLRFIAAMVLYGTIGPMTRFIAMPSEVVVLLRGIVGTLFVLLFMRIRSIEVNREAIRVINEMPKWSVGKVGNHAVPVRVVLPIAFRL